MIVPYLYLDDSVENWNYLWNNPIYRNHYIYIRHVLRGFTLMGPFPFLYMDRYSADDMMMTFYIDRHIFLNWTGDIK